MTSTVNVRATDPATSRAAAAIPRSTLRARVEDVLLAHPAGLTDWELVDLLGEPDRRKPSVTKRRQEAGAVPVVDLFGEPVTRRSPFGCQATVWVLPQAVAA